MDHHCVRLSAGLSRSASAPALAPPKVQPGVVVNKAPVGVAVAKAAAPPPASVLLQALETMDAAAALEPLFTSSPAAAADMQPQLIRAFGEEQAEVCLGVHQPRNLLFWIPLTRPAAAQAGDGEGSGCSRRPRRGARTSAAEHSPSNS